jgi:uncharacterized protein with PIN domain
MINRKGLIFMARRLLIRTRCPICGDYVETVPDGVLKAAPDDYNVEYVVTHSGYKQYLHSSCWYGMIEKQKKEREKELV